MEPINFEQELLRRSAAGDQEAFSGLFHVYKHKLYSFLLRATGSPQMTEDLIQDIFLRLWKNRQQLVQIEQFGGYIYRMAHNHALNAFKRTARETLILAELQREQAAVQAAAEEHLSLQEVREKLQAALNKLPPKQRLVYTLSRDKGLKHDEIARQLNISPSTVNNHMIEALRSIRRQLRLHLQATGAYCLLALTGFLQKFF